MNAISLSRLALVYPELKVRVTRVYADMQRIHGRALMVTETLRDFARQKALYEQGRVFDATKQMWVVADRSKIVTDAPPGMSFHAYGLAVDSAFSGPDLYLGALPKAESDFLWAEYGRVAKAHGLVWGGDWNGNGLQDPKDYDRPHVQMTFGLGLRECLDLYSFGGVKAVWAELDKIRGIPVGQDWEKKTL